MFDLMPRRHESFVNHFFGDDFYSMPEAPRGIKADIKETDDGYTINMDMPGYAREDISITAKNDVLTVSAEKKEESEEKTDNYIRRERFYGSRQRCFSLKGIDQDSINAKVENGVLMIDLKKDAKLIEEKAIEIR